MKSRLSDTSGKVVLREGGDMRVLAGMLGWGGMVDSLVPTRAFIKGELVVWPWFVDFVTKRILGLRGVE